MTRPPYRLVVFDFDGTLADSFPWFTSVINDVADRYRFRRIAPHETHELRGMDARGIVRHLGIPGWKLPFITRHMHRLAARDIAAIPLFPGVPAMLAALDGAGLRLGIASSNRESNIRQALGPAGSHVRHYACGASLFGKAKRLGGLIGAAGFAPSETLYIGDEIRDQLATREVGCDFGAVTWGYTRADALAAHGPAHLFPRLDAIPEALMAVAASPQGPEKDRTTVVDGLPKPTASRDVNL